MEAQREKELIQQVLQGNTKAFTPLVDAHKNQVFNLVVRMVQQRTLAEELSQDVFVKAYQQLTQFKHKARFSTWLFRIAYNTAVSALRKRQVNTQTINEAHTHIEDENREEKKTLLLLLQKAMEQLPAEEAALITLCYNEGKSIEEIAQITGLSRANIKVKLHRIRVKLKTIVENNKDYDEYKN